MGQMKNLLVEQEEALYEEFVEAQRNDLRNEGAEELRNDILRELKNQSMRAIDKNMKLGIETAIVVVERAYR